MRVGDECLVRHGPGARDVLFRDSEEFDEGWVILDAAEGGDQDDVAAGHEDLGGQAGLVGCVVAESVRRTVGLACAAFAKLSLS